MKKGNIVTPTEQAKVMRGWKSDFEGQVLSINNKKEFPIAVFIMELGRTEFFNKDELIRLD